MLLCEAVILYMNRSSQAERKMACRGWDLIEKAPLVTPAPAAMKRRGLIDMDVHSLAQQNTHFDAQVCTHCGELTPPKDPVMMIGKKCFCSISSYNHSRAHSADNWLEAHPQKIIGRQISHSVKHADLIGQLVSTIGIDLPCIASTGQYRPFSTKQHINHTNTILNQYQYQRIPALRKMR